MRTHLLLLTLVLLCAGSAAAQSKNELGLLLGETFIPDQTILPGNTTLKYNSGLTLQATYARKLFESKVADFYAEVPFLATAANDIRTTVPVVPRLQASIFITPGVRVKLFPKSRIAPFLAVGGGYARFEASNSTVAGTANPGPTGVNTGALQLGGGADIKFWRFVGLRGEIRDFYSGLPQNNVSLSQERQHTVVISGGLVLHF